MNNNNGGPAFPAGVVRKSRPIHDPGAGFVVTDITEPRHHGITMRDYFAAKSLHLGWKVFDEGYSPDECSPENIAKFAYLMADAMLAEREKGTPK